MRNKGYMRNSRMKKFLTTLSAVAAATLSFSLLAAPAHATDASDDGRAGQTASTTYDTMFDSHGITDAMWEEEQQRLIDSDLPREQTQTAAGTHYVFTLDPQLDGEFEGFTVDFAFTVGAEPDGVITPYFGWGSDQHGRYFLFNQTDQQAIASRRRHRAWHSPVCYPWRRLGVMRRDPSCNRSRDDLHADEHGLLREPRRVHRPPAQRASVRLQALLIT